MANELYSLAKIFNQKLFRIPDYQRGFAWTERELKAFWQDLERLGETRNHYTGQLTLETVPPETWKAWPEDTWLISDGFEPFFVVDGQQRLTTAIILIKCLLEKVATGARVGARTKEELEAIYLVRRGEVSRAYVFGYQKDNPSYEYLKTQILEEPSNAFQGTQTSYTANLLFARDYFRLKLKDATAADIERWFKALSQRFLFNVYELAEELDVFVVFETMNNRGKQLSKLELLKNRLIYLSTLAPAAEGDKRALRDNINEGWKTVYEFLGRERERVLDDDEFLRAHWIMYFTYPRDEAGRFAVFLLEEHFTVDRVITGELPIAELQRYVTSIQNSVRCWHQIQFPHLATALPDEVRSGLERLSRVGLGAFAPLTMAVLQKDVPAAEKAAFHSAAERFVFLVGRVSQRRADIGDTDFYRVAGLFHRDERTLVDVTAMVEQRTNNDFSLDRAKLAMRELFEKAEGFYSWSGRYYFLFEYEQFLKAQAGVQAVKINWEEFTNAKRDHVTVEHVFPRSPVAGEWPAFEAGSEDERWLLLHTLGNLLALSQSRNSKFSNRSFATKKQDAEGVRGYFNGSYSEIAVAQAPDWTPERVLERGLAMLGFLETRWQVTLGTAADKVHLLNLEFLQPAPVTPQAVGQQPAVAVA